MRFVISILNEYIYKKRATENQGDTSPGPINSLMYINMKIINMSKINYVNKSEIYNSDFG